MAHIGNFVIYVIMGFAAIGAIAAIRNDQKGLGKEFIEGIYSIGPIFLPVAGIMASIPYLTWCIDTCLAPLFESVNAHAAMAATTLIAVDMGGYHLAYEVAKDSPENWIMASVVGYMAGATIVFSIPVGLALLPKRNHKYMALGVMSGILSVPVGVLVACGIIALTGVEIRDTPVTKGDPNYALVLDASTIFANLTPLVIFCVTLALGLRFKPDLMIRLFLLFGRVVYAAVTIILAVSIIEHFTKGAFGDEELGLFSTLFSHLGLLWWFDPVVADENETVRALEVAGYIGMMLAGAFPMVYVIKKQLAAPITALGTRIGLEPVGAAGILAAAANILAMFRLIDEMRPKDKVLNIAFAVCAAFMFGDHLAFTGNYQPTLVFPILVGKLAGGITGFLLALWLSVPKAEELGKEDQRRAEAEDASRV
jgi:ethanolamine transporter